MLGIGHSVRVTESEDAVNAGGNPRNPVLRPMTPDDLDANHSVAGFAAIRGNEFLRFGTALGTWGGGLARRAHDEVLTHWVTQGYRDAWLTVFEENVRARRFYERSGWGPTGERSRSDFAPYPVLLTYNVDLSGTAGSST